MKNKTSHPLVIYNVFFLLYGISFPALGLSSLLIVDTETINKVIFCNSIGLASFIFGVMICSNKVPRKLFHKRINYNFNEKFITYEIPIIIIIFLFIISAFPIYKIISNGYINKQEIKKSGEIFLRFYSIFYPLIIYTIAYVINSYEKGLYKKSYLMTTIGILYSIIIIGITGERDIFFYFILMILLYIFDIRKKYTGFLLLVILLSSIIILPITHTLKGYLISGPPNNLKEILDNGVIGLLHSDFSSAGSNLYNIIYYTYDFHKGERLSNDLLRVFSSNLFGINPNATSATEWYKLYFINSSGAGRGFSIIAEGYLDFGYTGIIVIMFIIGVFLQTLYRYRRINSLTYVYYIFTLLSCCYSIRADLANIINMSLKLCGIPLSLVYLYTILTKKKNQLSN